jgi:Crinkler effector protein N-terminal domain
MANTLALNCLISGDDPDRIFTIEIENNKTVGVLKKAIKDEKPLAFQHVYADALVPWKGSLPVDERLREDL